MASKAILRRKRFIAAYVNSFTPSIQSFQFLGHANSSQKLLESQGFCSTGDYVVPAKKLELLGFSGIGQQFGRRGDSDGIIGNTRSELFSPLGTRWMWQSIRNASTAAAKQQVRGNDEDDNAELVLKKRKEASPEECDQAVEGLSSAKAKAKAKKLQESQKVANSVLQRVWTMFLGIGPALRAVASISK